MMMREHAISYIQTVAIGVVLAVIVVAATPILTSYSTADSTAKEDICVSNLKQIGLGFIQYSQDYDEKMPNGIKPIVHGRHAQPTGLGWAVQIYPYVKSDSVFKCPSDMTLPGPQGTSIVSYGMNSNTAKSPVANFNSPAETILVFEVSHNHSPVEYFPSHSRMNAVQLSSAGDGTSAGLRDGLVPVQVMLATGDLGNRPDQALSPPRHMGRSNFLFSDGHVKLVGASQVSSGENASFVNSPQTGSATGRAAGTGYATGTGWNYTFSVK